MSIKIQFNGCCAFTVTLSDIQRDDFNHLMVAEKKGKVFMLRKIIERGLIELLGELPEKRSKYELER